MHMGRNDTGWKLESKQAKMMLWLNSVLKPLAAGHLDVEP